LGGNLVRAAEMPPAAATPDFQVVVSGVDYAHWREESPAGPWSIHVGRVERARRGFAFTTPLAQGTVFGLSPVSAQVKAVPPSLGTPRLAVNGDFFVIKRDPYQGDPQGLQIWNGEVVSAPKGGACFWLDAAGAPQIGLVESRFRVAWPDGTRSGIGLNEVRETNRVVLYTPKLGASTRAVNGCEAVLEPAGSNRLAPLAIGTTVRARIGAVHRAGDTSLPMGGWILSLGPAAGRDCNLLQPGDEVALSLETQPALDGVDVALGGGPILVAGGRVREWPPPQPRHPRTALGWNDRHYFLVIVDGRQPGRSVGMTFPELADLMLRLGCREAMNLDGGGSSTFWLEGRVRNRPSDGRERPVANSLILVEQSPDNPR
jgi:hypothetical protein